MLNIFIGMCKYFGVPVADEKTVLPTTVIEFLEITLYSSTMECRLPEEKNIRLRAALLNFITKKKITLKELQSLVGLLNFAVKIIPIGRTFSHRLYDATRGFSSPHSHIRIASDLKEDARICLRMFCFTSIESSFDRMLSAHSNSFQMQNHTPGIHP
ncbi:unnamed protein product [Ranitomeya imitator]|uniref:Uncharacterized protein n=1 Tax=Ranitomeya imitator TaxID=111125 RepID=A0ABN9KYF6_9NEOB|nr:unnamed protein product [Ranitomeya imitator]